MTDSAKANDLLAQLPKGKGPAPVHLWNPDFCGNIDMHIARDGTWYYQGTPIGRKPMVKLFSNIIRRDGDEYFLVTPVEKVGITVEDAPFVAVTLEVEGRPWSTEQLAVELDKWRLDARTVNLMVGGPEGLAPEVQARSEQRWSLSPLTLPHPLVRILIGEQMYRAWTVLSGHPYHK